jgi:NAD-dependent deacetylase
MGSIDEDPHYFDPQWSVAIDLLRYSKKIVVLTGAGVSTESGLSDFRSPNGLWARFDPMVYANYNVFLKKPEYYWELERATIPEFADAKPNATHKALVNLEKFGTLQAIITQNIDNFHQKAGSKVSIVELHGNAYRVHCLDCEREIKRNYLIKRLKAGDLVPICPYCGGRIKTGVILFNEPLGEQVINTAMQYAKDCDLMFVLGTSLLVFPANMIPIIAKKAGAKLIFINREPTYLDKHATLRFLGNIGTIFPALIKEM